MGADPLICLLATIGTALITALITAAVVMFLAVQQTRRQQIEYHGVNVIADAVADCINAIHRGAEHGASPEELAEAQGRRAAAGQLLAGPTSPTTPVLTALSRARQPTDSPAE
jgi:hypothetical protein